MSLSDLQARIARARTSQEPAAAAAGKPHGTPKPRPAKAAPRKSLADMRLDLVELARHERDMGPRPGSMHLHWPNWDGRTWWEEILRLHGGDEAKMKFEKLKPGEQGGLF